ncbi:beta-propeller domain-containing protein [Micromonospora inyonensis]|uniref:Beta propeller domain-containing protein n=1 Tax=Micromonospora inyonensis TaxID=47866 RepID=A0A1C6RF90_9ACTN|nr:beta-propeller domain-containing protein [Micromonospora inyonensis]SCL15636.1 Beta propeller domain-containing protein [Micromonospora inyonensis]
MRRGIVALTALTLVTGCTAGTSQRDRTDRTVVAMRLVAFDSCADALTDLRAAARSAVGPWGLPGGPVPLSVAAEAGGARSGAGPAAAAPEQQPHSATNNHEADADEPDVVKTDGKRIVTLTGGVLRVVDPARRAAAGRLDLNRVAGDGHWWASQLLLHGDRAIVLAADAFRPARGIPRPDVGPSMETRVLLVDLAGTPRMLGSYRIDGELVDARRIGDTARVVVRSRPRIAFPEHARDATDTERVAANQAAIDRAPLENWLPRYEWSDDGGRRTGQLPCDRVSRPAGHTGAALLNLLSFDLDAGRLGDGDPIGVVAEGDTVYGTATSLYVAHNQGGRMVTRMGGSGTPSEVSTGLHRFDLTSPGRPRYVASGSVPGHLLNQYALSEWEGHLRVATTTDPGGRSRSGASSSAVYVLRTDGDELRQVGAVTGLGRGERIYSVRYLGGTGYVVTFRQTDPLYSLDLRDPTTPRVTGELKITGYSGHLQPAGEGRLLGVGQEADTRGARQGLLVSLFDVADPAKPTRLAHYHRPEAYSPAEHDPHALLFWPASGLVVLPVSGPQRVGQEALVLRTDGSRLTEVGRITHPGDGHQGGIMRSLVVGDTLWTLSGVGLQATDPVGLTTRGWIPAT